MRLIRLSDPIEGDRPRCQEPFDRPNLAGDLRRKVVARQSLDVGAGVICRDDRHVTRPARGKDRLA